MITDPQQLSVPHQPGMTDAEHDREQFKLLINHARHQHGEISGLKAGQSEVLAILRGIAAELAQHARESAEWRKDLERTIASHGEELTRNTAITAQVEAGLTTARTLKTIVGWAGAIGMGIVGIWAVVKAVFDKTPGIGP